MKWDITETSNDTTKNQAEQGEGDLEKNKDKEEGAKNTGVDEHDKDYEEENLLKQTKPKLLGKELKLVKEITYLGQVLTTKGTWTQHIKKRKIKECL